jgi:hypothetical protein
VLRDGWRGTVRRYCSTARSALHAARALEVACTDRLAAVRRRCSCRRLARWITASTRRSSNRR